LRALLFEASGPLPVLPVHNANYGKQIPALAALIDPGRGTGSDQPALHIENMCKIDLTDSPVSSVLCHRIVRMIGEIEG